MAVRWTQRGGCFRVLVSIGQSFLSSTANLTNIWGRYFVAWYDKRRSTSTQSISFSPITKPLALIYNDALVPPEDAEPTKPAFPSYEGDAETLGRETLVPAVRADTSPCSFRCKSIVIRWSESVPSTGSNKSLPCSPDSIDESMGQDGRGGACIGSGSGGSKAARRGGVRVRMGMTGQREEMSKERSQSRRLQET